MKNKTIYQLVSLVMALVMILGSTIQTQAAPAAQTTGPSIYWGALVDGKVPSSTNLQGIFATFETRSKKKMSIIHWGQPWMMGDGSWGEFQTTYFQNVRNHGSIPMLNWNSWRLGAGSNQPDFQLRDVYGGRYDTYLRRWATAAKNWGHPFFLRFNHEMNGWWYPWGEGKLSNGTIVNGNSAGDYVKAWRHVHDLFESVGATNITWVWAPNHISTSSQYPPALSTLYPGDAYVDWTGLSAYNKYPTWLGLNSLLTGSGGITWLKNSYNIILNTAPTKPIMLAETASIEAGDGGAKKAAWIRDALTTQIPINFPKIKAIVWMNWDVNAGETYPIESSQAATDAWANGIGLPIYAANQFANLNISPIPPLAAITYTISGNTGVGGVTLHSINGTLQSVVSDGSGNYSIPVPAGWSGTVAPTHECFAFSPVSQSYNNLASDQINQNFSPAIQSGCADVSVLVGGANQGRFGLPSQGSTRISLNGLSDGPVQIASSNAIPLVAAERVIYEVNTIGTSFSEMMGLPNSQLDRTYWLPWYNNVDLDTQLRFANVSDSSATLRLYIHGIEMTSGCSPSNSPYTLPPGASLRVSCTGINDGPVKIESDHGVPIVAAERVIYSANGHRTSFSEMMAFPNNQVHTTYWLPWYNNVDLDTQLRVANLSTTQPALVHVSIAGQEMNDSPFFLQAGESTRVSFPGINAGPVKIESDQNIVATARVIYKIGGIGTSFTEMMALPNSQLDTTYWLPWYNNVDLDTQLRFANTTDLPASVHVYIGGEEMIGSPFILGAGESTRQSFEDINDGPVQIVSDAPIVAAERVIYQAAGGINTSFSEMMALPHSQLDSTYWLPWYNNIDLDTQLRVGRP